MCDHGTFRDNNKKKDSKFLNAWLLSEKKDLLLVTFNFAFQKIHAAFSGGRIINHISKYFSVPWPSVADEVFHLLVIRARVLSDCFMT